MNNFDHHVAQAMRIANTPAKRDEDRVTARHVIMAALVILAMWTTLVMASTIVATAPAHGADEDTGYTAYRSGETVAYDGCRQYPLEVYVPAYIEAHENWYDWTVEATVYDPAGRVAGSGREWWYRHGTMPEGESTEPITFTVCGGGAGTWTVRSTLHYYNPQRSGSEAINRYDYDVTTFTVRAPIYRVEMRVNDRTARKGQRLRFNATSYVETPNGMEIARVILQKRVRGQWRTFCEDPISTFHVRWPHARKVLVRAVGPGSSTEPFYIW